MLNEEPVADVAPVVHCKDCIHYDIGGSCIICGFQSRKPDDFCSYGERKNGVLQTKVNRKNEKSPAKFTRPKMGITKQAGEKSHRQPG